MCRCRCRLHPNKPQRHHSLLLLGVSDYFCTESDLLVGSLLWLSSNKILNGFSFSLAMMTSTEQVQLAASLDLLRAETTNRHLCLFLGEQLSATPQKDLKGLIDLLRTTPTTELVDFIDHLEAESGESAYHIHHVLRSIGCFPVILTVCVDQFIEHYLIRDKHKVDKIRLDYLTEEVQCHKSDRTLLIKCLGDTSCNPALKPQSSCLELYQSLSESDSEVSKVIEDLFQKYTVLFFGIQRDDPVQAKFLQKFAKTSKRQHFLFECGETTDCVTDGSLTVLRANTSPDEFAQYLSSGQVVEYSLEELKGKVLEVSFLPTQREQYLLQQLYLEQQSVEIGIQTVKITNALCTDELLNKESRPAIRKIFENDPFMGRWDDSTVDKVMTAMVKRRNNLLKVSSTGTAKVTAVFSFQAFLTEISSSKLTEETRKMALRKYTMVILHSCSELHSSYNLWLRAIPPEEDAASILDEKFGIFRLKGGQDEGIAYAEPAIIGKKSYTSHFLSINGPEVLRKRRIIERSLTQAWDHERTVFELTVAVLRENKLINALSTRDRQCLESLQSVQVLSEMNLITGSFERISEGSFGEVFKAKWSKNGVIKNVAVKILKNISSVVDLDNYRREYESMRKAKHPNIVEVYEPYRKSNQLGLIMEFMEGGSIRDVINKNPGVGLSREFTYRCAHQVALALAFLHQQQIWHRDIKVDNIFLSGDHQTVKIGDFGLAKLKANTRNTNTQDVGSYRYMAPEVASGTAMGKYSAKADVYSYGLMLAEIMMGNLVFSNIPIHQEVYKLKVSADLPVLLPEHSEEHYGALMCNIVKHCVQRNPQFRLAIQQVLNMLDKGQDEVTARYTPSTGLYLLCLGTGKGATAVIHNEPSSSFVILNNGHPLLLVDMGLGVLYSYRNFLGDTLPKNIFLTHNHSDHTGDLPVFFGVLAPKLLKLPKKALNIIAAPEVMTRVKNYRMHEIVSHVTTLANQHSVDPLANWVSTKPDFSQYTYLDEKKEFAIKTLQSQHSETCFGFVLYHNEHPVLGYSADSGFNSHLYETVYQADLVIVDARLSSSYEHASFVEVQKFSQVKQHKNVYVIGYGTESEAPSSAEYPELNVLETGSFYALDTKPHHPLDTSDQYPSLERAV